MKNMRRWLAVLLCAFMLAGTLPAGLAESLEKAVVETVAEPEREQESGSFEDQAVPSEPAAEPGSEPEAPTEAETVPEETEAQEPVAAPAEDTSAPEIDYARDASHSPAFVEGYAETLREAHVYAKPDGDARPFAVIAARSVVYVSVRKDRLEAHFASGSGEWTSGWLDAADLRPMSAAEVDGFMQERSADGENVFYKGDINIPLDRVDCRIIEDEAVVHEEAVTPEAETDEAETAETETAEAEAAETETAETKTAETETVKTEIAEAESDPEAPEVHSEPVEDPEAEPLKMTVQEKALTLGIGESYTIAPAFSDGAAHGVKFATAKKAIASVSAKGVVKGVRAGTTKITVTGENGDRATVTVAVKKAPKSVTMTPKSGTMGVGEVYTLRAALPSGTASALTFVSDAPEIVSVDAAGTITALAVGTARIRVATFNGKSAQSIVNVCPAPETVTLSAHEAELSVGEKLRLTASFNEGSHGSMRYSSDDPAIAAVDAVSGTVTAVAPGTTVIRGETQNGLPDSCAITVYPAPTGIRLSAAAMTMGVGQVSLPLEYELLGGEDVRGKVSFSSAKPKIATVTANGEIKAIRTGTAKITATTHNGKAATVTVTVKKAPKSISLGLSPATLGVGETGLLVVTPNSGTACGATYSDYDASIVRINAAGQVEALSTGRTKITAISHNGKRASCTVTVLAAPEAVELSAAEKTLGVGQGFRLQATVNEGSAGACHYESGDPTIAAVNANTGAVSAVSVGETDILAISYNGKQASCHVTVKPAPSKVTVTPGALTIGVGETWGPLNVDIGEGCEGSWGVKSNKPKIVAVNGDGTIKGVRVGTAKLTVTTHNGKTATVSVTVQKAPTSVAVSPAAATLGVGEQGKLSWTLSKGTAGSVTLTGFDPEIISVDADNTITALAVGSTRVTVATYNGKKANCTVTVLAAPEAVELSAAEKTLGVGQGFRLQATVNEGSAGACHYESADPTIAAVNANTGAVSAVSVGETDILAISYNGKQASCHVTVKPAPSKVTVTPGALTIGVGETWGPLNVDIGEGCEGSWGVKSNKPKIVAVNGDGTIKGVRAGTAKLTVTTHNGKTATVSVTVQKAPTSVAVSPAAATLGVGEQTQLKWALNKGTAGGVSFIGYDAGVVEVSESGLVTAVGVGRTTVTVKTFNGKKAACTITVKAAPEGLSLSPETLVIGAGATAMLLIGYTNDCAGSCTFVSEDAGVAKVNAKTGLVTAVEAGTTRITATTYNGLTASCTVEVTAAPTGVSFQEKSVSVCVGDAYQLLPPVLKGEGAVSALTYSSSNSKYFTVSPSGLIKGVRAGTMRVKVSTYNGKSDTIYVYIKAAPREAWFAQKQLTLNMDDTLTPEVRFTSGVECRYTLSIPAESAALLALEADGVTVRALAPGKGTLTATSFNGLTASVPFEVLALPDSVKLNMEAVTLGQKETFQLKGTMPAGQGSRLEYTSSNEQVATVDEKGLVRAVGAGTAAITVQTVNGKTDSCDVTVLKAPTGVTLTPETAVRALDEECLQLTVRYGAADEGGSRTFTSSDNRIATVDSDGLVTFLSAGRVKITVKTYNNYTAVCALEICTPPTAIAFARTTAKVAAGDRVSLPVKFTGGGSSYLLEADDDDIISVDGEWVTGLKEGTTTLRALTYNGLTASCEVTVVKAPTKVSLSATSLKLTVGEKKQLTAATNAADGLGTCSFSSSEPAIAAVDARTGLVTAVSEGETTIRVQTYNGLTATCAVEIVGLPTYRALVAGEYASSKVSGYLPFIEKNVAGVVGALKLSARADVKYAKVTAGTDKGKQTILSAIRTQFADAKPYDVSVIYIVAHGLGTYTGVGEYVLGTSAFASSKSRGDLISATELIAAVQTIPGKVILILDSCYSGAFLDKYASRVAKDPDLAVLCSAHGNTRSSYWNVKGADAVEYYTCALLEGLGYNVKTGAKLALKADLDGNGVVTVAEAAQYADRVTRSLVAKNASGSKFHGHPDQAPQCVIDGMEAVPIVAR